MRGDHHGSQRGSWGSDRRAVSCRQCLGDVVCARRGRAPGSANAARDRALGGSRGGAKRRTLPAKPTWMRCSMPRPAPFGRIHILVNNAAVTGPIGPFDAVDWNEWLATISVNLAGTAYCTRRALSLFKPHRYGKIINISGGGAADPLPRMSAYAACKAAIARFTETLALEVRDHGIDVNAVAPGPLATRMFDQMIAAGPERIGAEMHASIKRQKSEGANAARARRRPLRLSRLRGERRPDRAHAGGAVGPLAVYRGDQGGDR